MIIYAIYIVGNTGRILFSEVFQRPENIEDEFFLGALVTSLETIITDIHASTFKSMEIEGISYHVRSFGLFKMVIVTPSAKTPNEILQVLGFRFIKEYGEALLAVEDLEIFAPFKKTIAEIIEDNEVLFPSCSMSTADLFGLPHDIQSIVLALLSLGKGNHTATSLSKESHTSVKKTRKNLQILLKMGFIGRRKSGKRTTYFCDVA